MSMHIDHTNMNQQAPAAELSNLGSDIRNPELQESSVGLLEASQSDSARMFALLGAGPEVPGAPGGRLGGRSYTELMVEVQKALAQMAFDTKIVNREQSVAYGKAKAVTIDDGADKIRSGAVAAFAGAMAGALVNIGFNAKALKYANQSRAPSQSQVGGVSMRETKLNSPETPSPGMTGKTAHRESLGHGAGADDLPSAVQGNGTVNSNTPSPNTSQPNTSQPNTTANRSRDADADGQADVGNQAIDQTGGTSPDGQYVSPMMNIYSQFGAAGSTILSNTGDIIDKHDQADKMELDADGQLFDTYSGEQSQFYSDANQNVQRALGLIGSFVGQIYNTNTSIIASMPR